MFRHYLFLLLLLCPLAGPAAEPAPLQVLVSIPPQRYLVERIGGEHVRVRVMLAAGQAPETFDPSMRKLETLEQVRLYFLIGVPFETVWRQTLRDIYPGMAIVPCCAELLAPDEQGLDPHVWTSPRKAREIADLIMRVLIEVDPLRRHEYAANHARLDARLAALDDYARRSFSERRTDVFITAHSAWGHLAHDYGLREVSLESNGREIGPRGLAQLVTTARDEGIHTLFVQPNHRSPVVRTLAHEIDADVVALDPLAGDYPANMKKVIDSIAEALQ